MKRSLKSLLTISLGGLFLSFSSVSYSQTELALVIASDANGKPENYQVYSDSLAKTLSLLSSAQLDDVFQGETPPIGVSSEVQGDSMKSSQAGSATAFEPDEEVNLSPEYEAALDGLLGAQANLTAAGQALADAQAALQVVLDNAEELIGDDIFGNFLFDYFSAASAVMAAQEAYNSAESAVKEATTVVDSF